MIEIKIMTEQAYKTLQKNNGEITKMINDHPSDASWLKSYLGFEPYETKKFEIDDFELLNDDDYTKVAFENSIILYEALKNVPRNILCNIRFWSWITFEKAYKQAINTIFPVKESIVKAWWLPNNSRRDLMLQVVARNYFRVETSIDENNEDKYHLTKYAVNHSEIYRNIAYRNIGMLPNVCNAFIRACRQASSDFRIELSVEQIREIMKETSEIGSVMLIDTMGSDEIYNVLYPKVFEMLKKCETLSLI